MITVIDPNIIQEHLPRYFVHPKDRFITKKFGSSIFEACSFNDAETFISCNLGHALIDAAKLAFNNHLPIQFSPDDFWLIILQGFSRHIKENSEKYRYTFVSHSGQIELSARRDNFIKGNPQNDWPGVFSEFSDKIKQHIGEKHDILILNFSTTTPLEQSCFQMGLMDAMSHYFEYTVTTMCGIPKFKILGIKEDWIKIKENFNKLTTLFENDELIQKWKINLNPILDKIISSFDVIDINFWRNFYHKNSMSGSNMVSGWIQNLFLYLKDYENKFKYELPDFHNNEITCRSGINTQDFPLGVSRVPFVWNLYGIEFQMEFIAGHIGVTMGGTQNIKEEFLKPMMGWIVREIENSQ